MAYSKECPEVIMLMNRYEKRKLRRLDKLKKLKTVPNWNIVRFPTGVSVRYLTLKEANNARILARAWANLRAQYPEDKQRQISWAAMSRFLGIEGNNSKAPGMPFYTLVANGKLPKDPKAKAKLFELAGYPWK